MWNKIIGHEKQKEQLKRTIKSKNIPHAYLFAGTSGIGKKLTAQITAATLLCSTDGNVPCGNCPNCHKLANNMHPDMTEIGPENNQITISLIREIKNQLRFPPLEGEKRAIIIDQAELMNANAANAALKILEEPPPGNHFFIITAMPSQLLPTIISRCQKLDFSPLTDKQLEEYLVTNRGYNKSQAKLAVEISEGSINKALEITPELINSVTDELYQALKSPRASNILELSAEWAGAKEEIENILYIIHRCFHNALVIKAQGSGQSSGNINKTGEMIASKNNSNQLLDKCNLINKSHSFITRTYNKQLMFEQLLFNLAA